MSYGYKFSKDYRDTANGTIFQTVGDLYYDEMKQEISFIIIAAGLTLIFSVILLAGLCTDCISPKAKHILATLTLILEFAIAVVLALRASNNSNMRDAYPGLEGTCELIQINTTTSSYSTDFACPTPSLLLCFRWFTCL